MIPLTGYRSTGSTSSQPIERQGSSNQTALENDTSTLDKVNDWAKLVLAVDPKSFLIAVLLTLNQMKSADGKMIPANNTESPGQNSTATQMTTGTSLANPYTGSPLGLTLVNTLKETARTSGSLASNTTNGPYTEYENTKNESYSLGNQEQVRQKQKIAALTDKTLTFINELLPNNETSLAEASKQIKHIISRSVKDKRLDLNDSSALKSNVLALAEAIVYSSPEQNERETKPLIVPLHLSFIDNKLTVYMEGHWREILCANRKCMAKFHGVFKEVYYSKNDKEWHLKDLRPLVKGILHGRTDVSAVLERVLEGIPIYKILRRKKTSKKPILEYVLSTNSRFIPFEIEELRNDPEPWKRNRINADVPMEVNDRGLLEQKKFNGKLYYVDRKNFTNNFTPSTQFERIPKMIDQDALIVSESLDGALRQLYFKTEVYHIYEITADNVRGVSLKENINKNDMKLAHFIKADNHHDDKKLDSVGANNHHDKSVDWEHATNGAIYFDEVHVHLDDLKPANVKCLGTNNDEKWRAKIKKLNGGRWTYWT